MGVAKCAMPNALVMALDIWISIGDSATAVTVAVTGVGEDAVLDVDLRCR